MPVKEIMKDLESSNNLRILQTFLHDGLYVYKDEKRLLNLASNDYLNLASNLSLQKEFFSQLQDRNYFFSSSSSRSLSGNFSIYEELENYLAELFTKESCLLFNSGYHLNISCMQALSSLPDIFFLVDRFAHASIFDGLLLGGKKFKRYRHNDMQDLESLLYHYSQHYKHVVIVSEALFSMDGDFARLTEICELKRKYKNVLLYLDEAHSVGAVGSDGLGLAKSLGLTQEIDFLVLTFGKAIASIGACVLCKQQYKDFFVNKARGLIYSTALPPVNIAFTLFIFQQLSSLWQKRERLTILSQFFKNEALKRGKELLGENQILSLLVHENKKALLLAKKLEENGFFAPAIRFPSVPHNSARIRFSLSADMQEEMIIKILENV